MHEKETSTSYFRPLRCQSTSLKNGSIKNKNRTLFAVLKSLKKIDKFLMVFHKNKTFIICICCCIQIRMINWILLKCCNENRGKNYMILNKRHTIHYPNFHLYSFMKTHKLIIILFIYTCSKTYFHFS